MRFRFGFWGIQCTFNDWFMFLNFIAKFWPFFNQIKLTYTFQFWEPSTVEFQWHNRWNAIPTLILSHLLWPRRHLYLYKHPCNADLQDLMDRSSCHKWKSNIRLKMRKFVKVIAKYSPWFEFLYFFKVAKSHKLLSSYSYLWKKSELIGPIELPTKN